MCQDPSVLKIQQDLVGILNCPCPCSGTVGCAWRGPVNHVLSHLITGHPNLCYLEGEEVVLLAVEVIIIEYSLNSTVVRINIVTLFCFIKYFNRR